MATRARSRIVVKSKSRSNMVSSSSLSDSSSDGPYTVPVTSTPVPAHIDPGLPPITTGPINNNTKPRGGGNRFKPRGNKVRPLIGNSYLPSRPHSVSGTVSIKQRESSSSEHEGDDVFSMAQTTPIISHAQKPRQMYLSTGQLLPNLYYTTPTTNRNRSQVVPMLNMSPMMMSLSPQHHLSYMSSPSPTTIDTQSTFSLSSPLPPLLIRSMRKGGTAPSTLTDWQPDSILESILPGGILKVFVGTWNMNEQKVLPTCIDDFFLPTSHETAGDLFIIGTQESTPNKQEWEILMQQTLGPSHVLIHSSTLGVLYLHVFLRRDLIWYCSDVQSSSYATRPINVIKTKGCVGVHLVLFGSSFLFLSSHLTAGVKKFTERNSDAQRTLNNLQLIGPDSSTSQKKTLDTHDFVFWCGDLNYRIELEKSVTENYIKKSDWMPLLLKDQLSREMLADNVFQGFSEQPIAFPPSYKFDVNSNIYDTSEKARTPSWTDRVLFRSGSGSVVVGCGYNSCDSLQSSDHRPVYALFHVELKPLEEIDGVPLNPAGYNRILYAKAMKRRKQQANTSMDLRNRETDNTPVPPVKITSNTNQTSSSVCIIL